MCRCRLEVTALLLLFTVVACNESPKASREEKAGAAAPVSAKTAFWEMYKSAHSWAADRVPLALQSKQVPGIKNEAGKAGMWVATLASPGRLYAREFNHAAVCASSDKFKGFI